MWEKNGAQGVYYREAENHIKDMNEKRFGGFDDWRMPTIEELYSLLESRPNKKGIYISDIFTSRIKRCWSSDTYVGNPKEVSVILKHIMDFSKGVAYEGNAMEGGPVPDFYYHPEKLSIRAVRTIKLN